MENKNNDRVVISGGTTGIGRALCLALAADGARVFIFGRHREALDETIAAAAGRVSGGLADVSKPADVERIFREAEKELGGIDSFIASAALGWQDDIDAETNWRYVMDVNLTGCIACTQEAAARMKRQGSGRIVLMGSMSAEVMEPRASIYAATKGAIRSFAGSLRKELNPHGIGVSVVEPGSAASDLHDESKEKLQSRVDALEMLTAEDVARTIRFILSQPPRCQIIKVQIRPLRQLI